MEESKEWRKREIRRQTNKQTKVELKETKKERKKETCKQRKRGRREQRKTEDFKNADIFALQWNGRVANKDKSFFSPCLFRATFITLKKFFL